MLKKALPVVALSSVLLVGCNMNDDNVPNNNETPMEDVREGVDKIVPDPNVNTPSPTNENGNDNFNNNFDNDGYNGGANGANNGINDAQPNMQNENVPNVSDGPIAQPDTGNNADNTNEGVIRKDEDNK